MSTGVSKERVPSLIKELIENGYANIEIKQQSEDTYLVFWR